MIQLIGLMLGFYIMMQAAVAFEVGRDKSSPGLKLIAGVTMAVAALITVGTLIL